MSREINEFEPEMVIIDPISSLRAAGSDVQVHRLLVRIIDFLKGRAVSTILVSAQPEPVASALDVDIVSIVDAWITLQVSFNESGVERSLRVVKARGLIHRPGD